MTFIELIIIWINDTIIISICCSTIHHLEDEIRSLRHVNNRLHSQTTHFQFGYGPCINPSYNILSFSHFPYTSCFLYQSKSMYLTIYIYLYIYLLVYLHVYLSIIYLFYLPTYLSCIYLSI